MILDADKPINGLTDSKKLTPQRRKELSKLIKKQSLAWAIGRAEPSEIDKINILKASLLAMARAYVMLPVKPEKVLVDGKYFPGIDCRGEAIIQGDLFIPEISAASILAKVARDEEMHTLDLVYPGYEFARHKGYPTTLHREKIKTLGVTELHRQSFAPVKKILDRCF